MLNFYNFIPENIKQKIIAQANRNETILQFSIVKLYFSENYLTNFNQTNIEGILTLVYDRIQKLLIVRIFECYMFTVEFEVLLYTNIRENNGYIIITEEFHTIQFPFGIIGLCFLNKSQANHFKSVILSYSKILNYFKDNKYKSFFHNIVPHKEAIKNSSNEAIKQMKIDSAKDCKSLVFSEIGFMGFNNRKFIYDLNDKIFEKLLGNVSYLDFYFKKMKSIFEKINKNSNDKLNKQRLNTNFIIYDEIKRKTIMNIEQLDNKLAGVLKQAEMKISEDYNKSKNVTNSNSRLSYVTFSSNLKQNRDSLKHLAHLEFRKKALMNEKLIIKQKDRRNKSVQFKDEEQNKLSNILEIPKREGLSSLSNLEKIQNKKSSIITSGLNGIKNALEQIQSKNVVDEVDEEESDSN